MKLDGERWYKFSCHLRFDKNIEIDDQTFINNMASFTSQLIGSKYFLCDYCLTIDDPQVNKGRVNKRR